METNKVSSLRKAIAGGMLILGAIAFVIAIHSHGLVGGAVVAVIYAILTQGAKAINPQAGQKIFAHVKDSGAIALLVFVVAVIVVFVFALK